MGDGFIFKATDENLIFVSQIKYLLGKNGFLRLECLKKEKNVRL